MTFPVRKSPAFPRIGLALATSMALAIPVAEAGPLWTPITIPPAVQGNPSAATRTRVVKAFHQGRRGACRVAVNPDGSIVQMEITRNLATAQKPIAFNQATYDSCVKTENCDPRYQQSEVDGVICYTKCGLKALGLYDD